MPTRRTLLRCGALGAGAVLAGCLDETDDSDPGGGDDGTGDGDGPADDFSLTVETVQFAARGNTEWKEDAVGNVVLADSEERLGHATPVDSIDEDHLEEVVGPFIEATDFDDSLILFVESGGPNLCHDVLEIEELAVEDDTIVGQATVIDTSEADEACGQAHLYPSALARIEMDGDDRLPETASITVTDGWEETATIEATLEDALSPDPEDLEGFVRPEDEPATVPAPLDCPDDGTERMPSRSDVTWGETAALAMRVDRLAVERGETVSVRMTNVTDGEVTTGNDSKYGLEVYTEAGWEDVRVYDADERGAAYTDEGIIHPPGEGFEWELTMSTDELETGHTELEVCPDLPAGRYRFVYWEGDLAVAFDLVD